MSQQKHIGPIEPEMEMFTVGAVMQNEEVLDDVLEWATPGDFVMLPNRYIFETIMSLRKQGLAIDPLTVEAEARRQGHLDIIGGIAYIIRCMNEASTEFHASTYAAIVAAAAYRRRLIEANVTLATLASEGKTPITELRAKAEAIIAGLEWKGERDSLLTMEEVAANHYALMEERYKNGGGLPGLSTGFGRLDDYLDGLNKGRLYILAARPGAGKTALMLNIALAAAFLRRGVVHITSLEMTTEQLFDRMVAITEGMDSQTIKRARLDASGWDRYTNRWAALSSLPFTFDRSDEINPQRLRLSALKAKRAHQGLALICVDYLGLMEANKRNDSRYQEVTEISRSLKRLAMELEVPVLALAQLNRQSELRGDKRPQLSDLRDSGAIEQDADSVMFVHRPEDKTQQNGGTASSFFGSKPAAPVASNRVELIVAKQRDGKIGTIPMTFDGPTQQFTEV